MWRDFSSEFAFNPNVFSDGIASYSNTPVGLFLLSGPFGDGLGVHTTHTIIELGAAGGYTERNFFQATIDGPDAMWDIESCGTAVTAESSLCVAATSEGAGDGLFAIDSAWAMTTVLAFNNELSVAYDASGVFDSLGGERLYEGVNGGIRLVGGGAGFITNDVASTMTVLSGGSLLATASATSGESQLVRIASTSHTASVLDARPPPSSPINVQRDEAFTVVRGDTSRLGGAAHAIAESREFISYDASGVATVLASTAAASGWRWIQAVAPPPGHALATDPQVLYVLESNRTDDRDRILKLVGPGT